MMIKMTLNDDAKISNICIVITSRIFLGKSLKTSFKVRKAVKNENIVFTFQKFAKEGASSIIKFYLTKLQFLIS